MQLCRSRYSLYSLCKTVCSNSCIRVMQQQEHVYLANYIIHKMPIRDGDGRLGILQCASMRPEVIRSSHTQIPVATAAVTQALCLHTVLECTSHKHTFLLASINSLQYTCRLLHKLRRDFYISRITKCHYLYKCKICICM